MNFLGIMNGLWNFAGIVQRLVCKPSKLEMRVRFPLPAPPFAKGFGWQATNFRQIVKTGENGVLGVRRSWRAGADCKSVVLRLRWFESTHSHQNKKCTQRVRFLFCGCGLWIETQATNVARFENK